MPISVDEKWIVAKYLADKAVTIKKGEYTGCEQKPQLRVIVFSDEARKFKPAEVKKEKEEDGTKISALKDAEIPYKDYKDYIKRNGQEGGFFFACEKEAKLGDIPCWQYEIKFEKLTVPRHVVTWVFRGDAADYAVEYEVLEDHWEKFQPIFLGRRSSRSSSSSARPRTSATGGTTGAASRRCEARQEARGLEGAVRQGARRSPQEHRGTRFQRAKEKLPPGWTTKNSAHFLVLTHADAKTPTRSSTRPSAAATGSTRTSRPQRRIRVRAVIRVLRRLRRSTRRSHQGSDDAFDTNSREIVTYKDANMGGRRSGSIGCSAGCSGSTSTTRIR